jgi:hypothetical protein
MPSAIHLQAIQPAQTDNAIMSAPSSQGSCESIQHIFTLEIQDGAGTEVEIPLWCMLFAQPSAGASSCTAED